jgi:hypothetical protein
MGLAVFVELAELVDAVADELGTRRALDNGREGVVIEIRELEGFVGGSQGMHAIDR